MTAVGGRLEGRAEALPRGTVTLLFTDIEGSTRLLQELGRETYVDALSEHRRVLRQVVAAAGGIEVEMQGDSFHFAFAQAQAAVEAAAAAQRLLAQGPIRVRIGIHTGEPFEVEGLYAGLDVHRAARVMAAGHGGQILLSETTAALVEKEFDLCGLGEHRLKDLSAPQRLYQLGGDEFPPLSTLHQTNLPIPATPFLGRVGELEELGALLSDASVRLLTLTGPGGSGKTRLAVQAAAASAESYPDGVFWVPLAPLRDPQLVLPTIGQTLRAKGDLPAHLAAKRLLLVLDNLEQLLDAAPKLAELLAACRQLTLLVTSRAPLRVAAERVYEVPPLPESDAVTLFATRALAAGIDVTEDKSVAELCRRLDGLPLAIELAAARTNVLAPTAMLARLNRSLALLTTGPQDAPDRHRTLEATIAWSVDLLSPAERQLFARLAVFAGGFTVDAAEQICHAELDTLESLADNSLVRRDESRLTMLELVREYAAARLHASGEHADFRRRHADFFAALAADAEAGWRGPDQPAWLERLTAEEDNVRAALDWLQSTGQIDAVVAVINGMRGFWYTRGSWLEGRRRAEEVLARTEGERTRRRAGVLRAAGTFAQALGELEVARTYGEESLAIFRALGETGWVGRVLCDLGVTVGLGGDLVKARRLFEEAARHLRSVGDDLSLAVAIGNLGDIAIEEGDDRRAASLLDDSLALYRRLGREHGLQHALNSLAFLHFRNGSDAEAAKAAKESLALSHRLGDVRNVVLGLSLFGALAARRGHHATAATLLAAAEVERLRVGLVLRGTREGAFLEAQLAEVRNAVGDGTFEAMVSAATDAGVDEAVARALRPASSPV